MTLPKHLTKRAASALSRPHIRAGVALAICIAIFITIGSLRVAYAYTNSTSPVQNPSNENGYPSSAVPSWLDTGSNAWLLTAATLVGLQALLGDAVFYAGLTKRKFVVNTLFMIFYSYSIILILWMLCGYNFGFGSSAPLLRIGKFAVLGPISSAFSGLIEGSHAVIGPGATALNIPTSSMLFFQFVFAAITPALFVGSIMERMNLKAWMLFVPLWSFLVYSPLAYWLFAGGWLNQLGAVDYSGGFVIHISAGITALAAAAVVGPRIAADRISRPNNLAFVIIGVGILWLGWNGFNGGDPFGSTIDAAISVLNTELSASASVIVWVLMDIQFLKRPTLIGATTACLTGLVAITPAAGYVSGYGALLIGVAGGIVPWIALNRLSPRLKVDDAMSVFPVHGVAGLVGVLLTGILADPNVTQYVDPGLKGLIYGNPALLGIQAFAALVVIAYVFLVSYGLLKLIGVFVPLQMSTNKLRVGDEAIHGEIVYDFSEEQ